MDDFTPKINTPMSYLFSLFSCCFRMAGFEYGSVCVCFRSGKVLEGVKRLEKVKLICRKSGSAVQALHSFPEENLGRSEQGKANGVE